MRSNLRLKAEVWKKVELLSWFAITFKRARCRGFEEQSVFLKASGGTGIFREPHGRFSRIQAFLAAFDCVEPDNIAVLGGWGIGKTSALNKFEQEALLHPGVFVAFIELSPASCTSFYEFSKRARDEIERGFKVSQTSLFSKLKSELLPKWRVKTIDLGIKVELENPPNEKSQITLFEDAFRELWKTLSENGIKIAVLMLDDLQYLAQKSPDALYDLRSIFQRLARDGCNFMLVATGPQYLFEAKEFAEPLSRFFDKYSLGAFGFEETKTAVETPLKLARPEISVDPGALEKIFELSRGHPFFVHFIMEQVVDEAEGGKITKKLVERQTIAIFERLAKTKFEYDFSKASEAEKQVLLEIARLPLEKVSPSQVKAQNARRYMRLLCEEKELLVQEERGKYGLYHPLFKEFLKTLASRHAQPKKAKQA